MIFNEDYIDTRIIHSFKGKDTLNTNVWETSTGSPQIKDGLRKKLIEISDEFIDSLNIDIDVIDITFTGSLANYNWSEFSDIDLHIILDFDDVGENKDFVKEFFDAKRINWNNKRNITLKGFEVELYIQDEDEVHMSSGVYSIIKNKWLIKPKSEEQNIDLKTLEYKVKKWMKIIDQVIDQVHSDSKNIEQAIGDVESIRKKLKRYRSTGLEEQGEYSYENLVFKYLRRNGYVEKLLDLKDELIDKQLSIFEQKNQ